jgi:chromosome partitioning protein
LLAGISGGFRLIFSLLIEQGLAMYVFGTTLTPKQYGRGALLVLIGNQKGGVGKSTLATNIAAILAQQGDDVVLVDADRQSTAANWVADRGKDKDLPRVHCVQKYDNIRETLIDLNARYTHVVVDAAGRDSRELRTGMTAADVLIVPFRPSQPDLDVLPHMQEVISQAKDYNPDLHVMGVITMAPTNPVINETREAKECLADYPDIQLSSTLIRDRKIYRDAMSEGRGVVEMNNSKARAEIELLIGEVFRAEATTTG